MSSSSSHDSFDDSSSSSSSSDSYPDPFDNAGQVTGFRFEPECSDDGSSSSDAESFDERLNVNEWCLCNNCTLMDRYVERKCCTEIQECKEKFSDAVNEYSCAQPYTCITEHPSFQLNCLRREVLDLAWLVYKQQYGAAAYHSNNNHKRWRHIAYRQLARFMHGIVGKDVRYVLPSCAVNAIRNVFPNPENENYTGFF